MKGKGIVCCNCFFDFWLVWMNTPGNLSKDFSEITADSIGCDEIINVNEFNLYVTTHHHPSFQVLFCICRYCSIESYKITKEANRLDSPRVAKIFSCKQIFSKYYQDTIYQMTHDHYQNTGTYVGKEYFLNHRCRTCKCLLCVKFTRTYLFNSLDYKDII